MKDPEIPLKEERPRTNSSQAANVSESLENTL